MTAHRVGAHVSIADGLDAAVKKQQEYGGTCGQIFVGSPRTWRVSEVDPDDAAAFTDAATTADIGPWIVHGTYLINFATPKDDLARKSIDTVQAELDAAAELGIDYYTFHPGSHTGAGVDQGIENIGNRLSQLDIPDSVRLLLENTAGGGTSLGETPEQLQQMRAHADLPEEDLGVCLDTCHLWAAGYDFSSPAGVEELATEIEQTVGFDAVGYLHINDSKHPLGSNKDEHQHIGEGAIGTEAFRQFVNYDRFRDLPMVLETPVDEKGYAWNIDRIRSLRT